MKKKQQLFADNASGELHYRRGYKEDAVAAPLRESVAIGVSKYASSLACQPSSYPGTRSVLLTRTAGLRVMAG